MPFVTSLVAALAGAALFTVLRIPAGALIGSMVGVAVVTLSPLETASLPRWTQLVAFTILGWLIGQGITRSVAQALVSRLGLISLLVVTLLLIGGLLAAVAVWLDVLDPATAFLATSPGGLSQMVALSTAIGANVTVVATVHTMRVITVILLAPVVTRFLPEGPG